MKYDVVVVGGGSAGAVIAARLSEDPARTVALVEAGPDYPDLERLPAELKYGKVAEAVATVKKHDWGYVGRATATNLKMPVPRGKVTGGCSAVNGQVFLRGTPADFDCWAAAGNEQWAFRKVLPSFRTLETDLDFHDEFHGSDGPMRISHCKEDGWLPAHAAFAEGCAALGFPTYLDQNHPESTGFGPMPINNVDGIRLSTSIVYLSPARQRENLTIWPKCTARCVIFEGSRAVGVVVEGGPDDHVIHAGEVILSAGAIGSPHLLLLSGIGPAEQLHRLGIRVLLDLPGVGQNLRDHPEVRTAWRTSRAWSPVYKTARLSQVMLRFTASGSSTTNDMRLNVLPFQESTSRDPQVATVDTLMGAVILSAAGKGELHIVSSDPTVQPSLNYGYFDEEWDRRRLREAVRLVLEIGALRSVRAVIGERIAPTDAELASDLVLDAWMSRVARTQNHISGTCKMGPGSDRGAVVDQFGRVHGFEGLRVADASIMPDVVRVNTNATTVMIGERISGFVKQRLN